MLFTNLQELLDCSRAVWARLKHVCEHLLSLSSHRTSKQTFGGAHTRSSESKWGSNSPDIWGGSQCQRAVSPSPYLKHSGGHPQWVRMCVCVSPSAAFSSELRVLQDRPVRLFSSAPLSNTHYNPASRSECVDVRANTAAFLTSRERLKCWLTFPVHSSQKKDIHTIYGYGLREEVRSKRSTYELNERTARKSSCRLLPFPFPSHFVALPFSLSLSPSLPPFCSLWAFMKQTGKKSLEKHTQGPKLTLIKHQMHVKKLFLRKLHISWPVTLKSHLFIISRLIYTIYIFLNFLNLFL